jgi:hypothetical protein
MLSELLRGYHIALWLSYVIAMTANNHRSSSLRNAPSTGLFYTNPFGAIDCGQGPVTLTHL